MTCACHGERMYWMTDARYRAGGFWRCAVKKRSHAQERYDRDPIHRISKNLQNAAQKRRKTIARRRALLEQEGTLHG